MRQLLRWTGGSAIGFSVNLGTAILLHEGFGVRTEVAVAVAYVLTWLTNFFLQRYVVFRGHTRDWRKQAGQFLVTDALSRTLEYGLFLLLHTAAGLPYFVAQIVVSSIGFVGKFLFYRRYVFGSLDSKETPSLPVTPGD